MKKMHTVFIMLAVVSVFVLSFLIGRATALRSEKEGDKTKAPIYTGTVPRPVDKSDTEAEDKAASAKARVKKTEDKTDGDEKAEDTGEGEGNKKEENAHRIGRRHLRGHLYRRADLLLQRTVSR